MHSLFKDFSLSAAVAGFIATLISYAGPLVIIFQAAKAAGLPDAVLSSWVWSISIGSGVLGIVLSLRFKVPVVIAWSAPGSALLVALLPGLGLHQAVGAYLVASALVLLVGLCGIFDKIVGKLPAAISAAMLAGILFSFGTALFRSMADKPLLVGAMFCTYLLCKRLLPRYAVLAVLLVGCAVAAGLGEFNGGSITLALAEPIFIAPEWNWHAIVNIGLPLALVTLWMLRSQVFRRHADPQLRLVLRLGACGLMILLGLSVPHFKRAYYILPMVPMFAAVAAYGLLMVRGQMGKVRSAYLWLVGLLPGLCILVLFVLKHSWHKHGYWPPVSMPLLIAIFALLQLLALYCWRHTRGSFGRRLVLLSALALAAQWTLLVAVVDPAKDRQFDTLGFVTDVEQLRAAEHGPLVFFNLGQDTWAVRYMMNLDHDEQPLFVSGDAPGQLDALPHGSWVIVARKDREKLQGTSLENQQPVYEGRLNDNPCLVFQLQ